MSPDRISLGRPGLEARLVHWLMFGMLLVIGLGIAAGGLTSIERAPTAGWAFLGFGLLLLAVTEIARRAHRREIDPGSVSFGAGVVTIDHPALFKRPLAVPLEQVRAAAVDATAEADAMRRAEGIGAAVAFPVLGDRGTALESRIRGYLWRDGQHFPIRRLGRTGKRPNVVLLFSQPVVAPELRRETEHGPRRNEALAGIAFTATDPEGALGLIRAYGIGVGVREGDMDLAAAISSGELPADDPDAITFEQAETRTLIKSAWGLLLAALFVPFLSVWALPLAIQAWRAGRKPHGVAIAAVGLAEMALAIALLASNAGSPARWAVSAAAVILPALVLLWRSATAPARTGG
jgi:hypothetical protein